MARSARHAGAALALVAVAPVLAGCVTTQQRNERAKLTAKRLLASRRPLQLGAPSADVRVARVSLIRERRRSAFVVEVTNAGARPAADVPVEVGVAHAGRRRVLNRRGGSGYFASHVASIPPHGRSRWVFVATHPVPRGARAFAVAGAPDTALPGRPQVLPSLTSAAVPGRKLRVTIRNRGSVPQYGLPVYAFARRGGRYVAAGRTAVAHLGTGATATIAVSLVGASAGATLETEALPSIFR